MHETPNFWVQATPGCAFLFVVSQSPGAPDPARWAAYMRRPQLIPVVILLGALTVQFCPAGSVVEPDAIGEWSQPTNNITGRLLFAGHAESKDGARVGLVYLELQNLSGSETMYVYYDALRAPPRCELRDSTGKIVEQALSGRDAVPEACWLTFPPHSTMRFLTGYGPAYGPTGPSLTFGVGMDQTWLLPVGGTNSYFLSGTFTATSPKGESREHSWKGTLKLPAVRIPVKIP
jgi:hypothetical protein